MNYKRTVKILQAAAKQADSNLKKEINSAITLIQSHSDNDEPQPGHDCTYNHNGQCWGQKCAPECTAKYGYCPLGKK